MVYLMRRWVNGTPCSPRYSLRDRNSRPGKSNPDRQAAGGRAAGLCDGNTPVDAGLAPAADGRRRPLEPLLQLVGLAPHRAQQTVHPPHPLQAGLTNLLEVEVKAADFEQLAHAR